MAPSTPDAVLPLDRFLRELGFDTPGSVTAAREVLVAAGLTRPGKSGMTAAKRADAEEVLAALLVRHCADERCAAWAGARDGGGGGGSGVPRSVLVTPAGCALCAGSNNRRSARLLLATCRRAGVARVVIVGGAPGTAAELARELPDLDVRVVDGSRRVDERKALADVGWAQVVVNWATTILDHKVSQLYTRGPHLTVARRGVEALCDELRIHLGG